MLSNIARYFLYRRSHTTRYAYIQHVQKVLADVLVLYCRGAT